jgi:hypothetical protein
MSSLWWVLIVFAWLGGIVFVVLRYRRKRAEREAEREKQFALLFAEARNARKDEGSGAPAVQDATAAVAAAATATIPANPAAPLYLMRERLLAPPYSLVYLLLRTALPEHEIFVNLALGDLVDVGPQWQGLERENRLRRLGQQRVDYVVCTRQLGVVAVVIVAGGVTPDAAGLEGERLRNEALSAAGIRIVRLDVSKLPRHPELRTQVLGA